ncbi:MAG: PQQ-dependent sugar dehydrogenase, partial [Ferruginibacter sp.]|nr:PQQ-dependent sugar dehydrogenase [Chitinophagaceae bacterium]
MSIKTTVVILIISLIACTQCKKKPADPGNPLPPGSVTIKDSVIAQFFNFPWEILWGPDNFIWVTERGGKISRVNPATGSVSLLHTIPDVVSNGEGGLLGMVLHPDFPTTPHVFVAYNYNSGGYKEKIVRFTYTPISLN